MCHSGLWHPNCSLWLLEQVKWRTLSCESKQNEFENYKFECEMRGWRPWLPVIIACLSQRFTHAHANHALPACVKLLIIPTQVSRRACVNRYHLSCMRECVCRLQHVTYCYHTLGGRDGSGWGWKKRKWRLNIRHFWEILAGYSMRIITWISSCITWHVTRCIQSKLVETKFPCNLFQFDKDPKWICLMDLRGQFGKDATSFVDNSMTITLLLLNY